MNTVHKVLAGSVAAASAGLALMAAPSAFAATPTASSGPAPSAQAAACDQGPWGARVDGVPVGLHAGSLGGDYLYHTATGFHLRITHATKDRVVFSGEITSATPMRIEPVKLEKGDVAVLSANHLSLVYTFVNYGGIDGVNFHTDCASSVTVSHLNMGDKAMSPSRVNLGHYRIHPTTIPFTIHRLPAKTS
jgi:hypothetical protein